MGRRLLAVLGFALLLGGSVVGFQLRTAEAQSSTVRSMAGYVDPSPGSLDAQELFRLDKELDRTIPGQVMNGTPTTQAQSTATQKVVTTASRAKMAAFAAVAEGVLLAGAQQIWYHNGLTIMNAAECGQTTCNSPAMQIDGAFKRADDANVAGTGGGMAWLQRGNGNTGAYIIEKYVYTGGSSMTVTYRMKFSTISDPSSAGNRYFGPQSPPQPSFSTSAEICCPTSNPKVAPYWNGAASRTYSQNVPAAECANGCQFWGQNMPVINGVFAPSTPFPFGGIVTHGVSTTWENPVYEFGEMRTQSVPESPPAGSYVAQPLEAQEWYDKIRQETCTPTAPPETTPEVCPDYFPEEWKDEFPNVFPPGEGPYDDPDGDEIPNHEDADDDNDGVPDADDPAPHDPYNPKTWLDPDFLAPSDPQQREALWGPVVGTWTAPDGTECKVFESGAQLCDSPGGSTFAWIIKDWVVWMQNADGSKQSLARHGDKPPPPSGTISGGDSGDEGIPPNDARRIAIHAITNEHKIQGLNFDNPDNVWYYEEYVYRASRKQNLQGEDQPANFAGPQVRTRDGARAWYDYERNAIIIHNPKAGNKGTVYSGSSAHSDWENFPNSDEFPYEK